MESYPELKDVPEEELIDLAELFKMFADSTRIKILYDLFQGEKNVTEICNQGKTGRKNDALFPGG